MRIDILTLFPEILEGALRASLLGKALSDGKLQVNLVNFRAFATDRHRTVDDTPYGGGAGMVLQCEPIAAALESLGAGEKHVVLLTPRGRRLDQDAVRTLAQRPHVVLLCARYEGVDERLTEALVDEEISIGDYVLSGGEVPALVVVEAVSRMIPGVVGDWESVETDSFYCGILGPPQYTRPPVWRGHEVPDVLKNGNHAAIRRWRRKEALRLTRVRRPELLAALEPKSKEDQALLAELAREDAMAVDEENAP